MVNNDNDNRVSTNTVGNEKLYYLDLKSPSITRPIESSERGLEGYRFVEVEVAEVVNPEKIPVTFQVHYQTSTNEKVYLGSFGLYPADNPGKFIVATQGKLKNEGAIILTLEKPENIGSDDTIRVGVKKIRFLKG